MSEHFYDNRLSAEHKQPVIYLTAYSAADLGGVTRATLAKYLPPDAVYRSVRGDKEFPLWLPSTVERFRSEYRDGRVKLTGSAL